MDIFVIYNLAYRLIAILILGVLVWNLLSKKDLKLQVMTFPIIMPFLLRVLNIK